jgi:hypothetical protein
MKVSKEKAIATFTYPYQSYGISFALDEINYEKLYEVFAAYCTHYSGFARAVFKDDSYWGWVTKSKETVRSRIDVIFNQVLALENDNGGFYKYGTVKAENGVIVNVCFSKLSDTESRVVKTNGFAAPLICFEIDIAYDEEDSIEHCFKLTVTKEKDLRVGLPDWEY